VPSIHALEHQMLLDSRPPVDLDDRTLLRERVLDAATTRDDYEQARYAPATSWTATRFEWAIESLPDGIAIGLRNDSAPLGLVKRITFSSNGALHAEYEWAASADSGNRVFTAELTLAEDVPLEHDAEEEWRFAVETVAKSERGLDRTRQGTGVLLRWPLARGKAWVKL
jgi:hypothetical protein